MLVVVQVLQADMQLDFEVQRISINRNGSALFLVGLDGLYVMYLYGRTSTKENTVICRYNFLLLVLLGYVFFGLQSVKNNSVINVIVLLMFVNNFSIEEYILLYLRKRCVYLVWCNIIARCIKEVMTFLV